jgi:CheY-like chemotaxis protein
MKRTVLLVEDNADNRTVYRSVLEHMGYDVQEAADGEEGIRIAGELRPDLILMDLSIPKCDGLEATRRLKAHPDTEAIPVVALTAHALPEDRARANEAGCDSCLAKPVEPARVLAEVERLIGRAKDSAA